MFDKAQPNPLKDQRILVIDDEPDSLEVVEILLGMYEADVVTATNGQEGLAAARKHRPVFIISDLSMPEMSGWDLLNALKIDRTTLDIPVIALTAHAMEGDRHKAIAAGFHNYLIKPLNPETFINDLLHVVMDIPGIGPANESSPNNGSNGSAPIGDSRDNE
jgi:CheY-like chemotaxis protein